MPLFTLTENLLPNDGIATYYGPVISYSDAQNYLNKLLHTIAWKSDEVIIFGKHITTKRKTAWYGDEPYNYTYSGIARKALLWTQELTELKRIAEDISGETYNSCLLNLYHDGSESMGWHSDNESSIKPQSAIASISLGAERKFAFKHKATGDTVSLLLENGSLLVMKGVTQANWLHRLPPTKKVTQPRVNLTFRTMLPQ
ncbi:MAG TPA: alpha-ketoglutarate-dependent dioxygenase AlkB [Chitinophagales bacterium]|nr:alpha-ketoglutarate-dependent dioxygenase AlkB [Chitinophagales bacterium]